MDKLEDSVPRWENPFNFDNNTEDYFEPTYEFNDDLRADAPI